MSPAELISATKHLEPGAHFIVRLGFPMKCVRIVNEKCMFRVVIIIKLKCSRGLIPVHEIRATMLQLIDQIKIKTKCYYYTNNNRTHRPTLIFGFGSAQPCSRQIGFGIERSITGTAER